MSKKWASFFPFKQTNKMWWKNERNWNRIFSLCLGTPWYLVSFRFIWLDVLPLNSIAIWTMDFSQMLQSVLFLCMSEWLCYSWFAERRIDLWRWIIMMHKAPLRVCVCQRRRDRVKKMPKIKYITIKFHGNVQPSHRMTNKGQKKYA